MLPDNIDELIEEKKVKKLHLYNVNTDELVEYWVIDGTRADEDQKRDLQMMARSEKYILVMTEYSVYRDEFTLMKMLPI